MSRNSPKHRRLQIGFRETTIFTSALVAAAAAAAAVPVQATQANVALVGRDTSSPQNWDHGTTHYLISPTLSSQIANALFVVPRIGRFDTPSEFAAAYNSKWGDFDRRVPAGTQVNFGNFECNQTTAQTLADTGGGGNHCFGGTIDSSGSAWNEGIAIVANLSGPGIYYGVDLSLNNNNEHTSAVLYWANCIGRATCGTAFKIGRKAGGDFDVGIDLAGHNIVRATTIDFASTDHANISGGSPDTLRISGGGSAGGMIIAGSSVGGRSGVIRFRRYATSRDDAAIIDPSSGDIATTGKIEAARGFQLPKLTVGRLPPCNAQSAGTMFFVTDAAAIAYRGRAVAGGQTATNVTCDGANWLYM